jgi:hypothetical protein
LSKGGSSQPTNQTITQTSIPKEFYPYLETALGEGQAITNRPYQPYPGPRLSDFSSDTQQAFDLNRQNFGSWMPFVGQGQSGIGQAMNMTQQATANIPGSNTLGNNVRDVGTQTWNTQAANQYMNPYINSVMNNLATRENQSYLRDQGNIAQSAQASGAYGGGRQAVLQGMAMDAHNQRLNELQSNQMSQAYNTGLSAFGQDQGRSLAAQQSNQQSDLTTQDLKARMDMQKAQLAMQGAAQMGQLGGQMAGLGQTYQGLYGNDVNALRNQGLQQEQLNQANYDLGYQNFTDQRDWDKNNTAFMAGLINGLPLGQNTTQTTQQYVNPFTQMVGAGLGAYGLYQNFRG